MERSYPSIKLLNSKFLLFTYKFQARQRRQGQGWREAVQRPVGRVQEDPGH